MKSKGFKWGYRVFMQNYEDFGELGVRKSDKASKTCRKYANDKSVKKTANGKVLDKKLRKQYKDIADGMLSAYNKIFK